jgi:hypothetical protein
VRIFRNEKAAGSNPASSTKTPWSGRILRARGFAAGPALVIRCSTRAHTIAHAEHLSIDEVLHGSTSTGVIVGVHQSAGQTNRV